MGHEGVSINFRVNPSWVGGGGVRKCKWQTQYKFIPSIKSDFYQHKLHVKMYQLYTLGVMPSWVGGWGC